MVKVTTKDSKIELYAKVDEYLNELYDVLLTGVKIGILQAHFDGESVSPKDMAEGIKVDVDQILSDIVDEFDDQAKKRINDPYRTVIDEI